MSRTALILALLIGVANCERPGTDRPEPPPPPVPVATRDVHDGERDATTEQGTRPAGRPAAGIQDSLQQRYSGSGAWIRNIWFSSPDSSWVAAEVRTSGEQPLTRIDIWPRVFASRDRPAASTGNEPGGDVELHLVFFEPFTLDGLPDLLLQGSVEEELSFPVLLTWRGGDTLEQELREIYDREGFPSADSIRIVRKAGRICAIAVPAPDSILIGAPPAVVGTPLLWFGDVAGRIAALERATDHC